MIKIRFPAYKTQALGYLPASLLCNKTKQYGHDNIQYDSRRQLRANGFLFIRFYKVLFLVRCAEPQPSSVAGYYFGSARLYPNADNGNGGIDNREPFYPVHAVYDRNGDVAGE